MIALKFAAVVRPSVAIDDEAKSAVAFKAPDTVEEAWEMNPPPESTEKSDPPVELVKRRKSPVAFAVDEACIRMVSVEVPARARRDCAASKYPVESPCAEETPRRIETGVVVGERMVAAAPLFESSNVCPYTS